jgi:hypothetical protein
VFGRSHITLLFIGRRQLVRADFDSGGRLRRHWDRQRPAAGELPEMIEVAARLDHSPVGRTWVLADDLWTQRLSLGRDQSQGLSPAEIERALAFEAESLSGQSAFDSDTSAFTLESTRETSEYWVLQIPHWVRDQAEATITRAGGKLAGMLHPSGLRAWLGEGSRPAAGWGRIERWGQVTLAVGQSPDGGDCRTLASGDPRSAGWRLSIERWRAQLGERAELSQLSEDAPESGGDFGPVLSLSDSSVRLAWLTAWGAEAAAKMPGLPFIAPPARPISTRTRLVLGGALLLATLTAVGVDYGFSRSAVQRLESQLEQLKRNEQELATAQKDLGAVDQQLADEARRISLLQSEVPQAEAARRVYRSRAGRLLEVLAECASEEVVIREIAQDAAGPAIRGAGLGLDSVNRFVVALGKQLAPLGWSPAPHYAAEKVASNGVALYRFEVRLVERIPQAPAAAELLAHEGEKPR